MNRARSRERRRPRAGAERIVPRHGGTRSGFIAEAAVAYLAREGRDS